MGLFWGKSKNGVEPPTSSNSTTKPPLAYVPKDTSATEVKPDLIHAILKVDPKYIGDVYRLTKAGWSPEQIAEKYGHKNTMNVTTFLGTISALTGDREPATLDRDSARQLVFALDRYISMASDSQIKANLESMLAKAKKVQLASTSKAKFKASPKTSPAQASRATESPNPVDNPESRPGVYVYSYPQYLSMESVSPDGKAFYKIGASGKVANRVERQKRQTEVPEDLVLVRVFYDEKPFELEEKFHSILKAANMHQKTTHGGAEWFSCNLATIDAIAVALKDIQS